MISSDEGQGFRRIAARIMELIIRRWYKSHHGSVGGSNGFIPPAR